MRRAVVLAVLLLGVTLIVLGCGEKLRTVSDSIRRDGIESLEAEVDIKPHANLTVDDGADEDASMEFTVKYDKELKSPEVERITDEKPEHVILRHEFAGEVAIPEGNNWELKLNDKLPVEELEIEMQSGTSPLSLGDLRLKRLDIEMVRDSNAYVYLTGEWVQNFNATIRGDVTSRWWLPKDVGVRVDVARDVKVDGARGLRKAGEDYTNDAYGNSEVELNITVEPGAGPIDMEVVE